MACAAASTAASVFSPSMSWVPMAWIGAADVARPARADEKVVVRGCVEVFVRLIEHVDLAVNEPVPALHLPPGPGGAVDVLKASFGVVSAEQ